MDDFAKAAFREREAKKILKRRVFLLHFSIFLVTNAFLVLVWYVTGHQYPWFLFPLGGWFIGIVAHGAATFLLSDPQDVILAKEEKRARSGDT